MRRRPPLSSRPGTPVVLLLAAALAAGPLSAADDRLVARGAGDGAPRVLRGNAGLRVESGGRSTSLAPPPEATVESVAALGAGWLIVGSRPDGDRREIWLLAGGDGENARELAPPPSPTGRVREGAVPVVADGRLAGLAWLEGDRRRAYAVRWAAWLGKTFDEPVEVSPPGAGSQLALAGARLDDGRTLLVWSGYDGVDDEIWASIGGGNEGGVGASWSKPARVGGENAVPDVTPTVVVAPGGAWVAWSRFDAGEYRLAVARLAGSGFGAARFAGEPGALLPTFEGSGETPLLLWRDARADLWTLGELRQDGSLAPLATSSGSAEERPAVVREAGATRLADAAPRSATTPR